MEPKSESRRAFYAMPRQPVKRRLSAHKVGWYPALLHAVVLTLAVSLAFLVLLALPTRLMAGDADDLLGGLTLEADADPHAPLGQYRIELVGPDGKSIESACFVRRMPGYLSVRTFPRAFTVAGQGLFAVGDSQVTNDLSSGNGARVQTLPADGGDKTVVAGDASLPVFRPLSQADLPVGDYMIRPFNLPFKVQGGTLISNHPGLAVDGKTLRILTVPVTFEARSADSGNLVPMRDLSVTFGDHDLLTHLLEPGEAPRYLSVTLYLPRGCAYQSSVGGFSIDATGSVVASAGSRGEKMLHDATFTQRPRSTDDSAVTGAGSAVKVGDGTWLWTPGLRRVFTRDETVAVQIVVAGEHAALPTLTVQARDQSGRVMALGRVAFPAIATGSSDARVCTVSMNDLPPGHYDLQTDAPGSHPFAIEVVDVAARTPLSLFSVNCCNGATFDLTPAGVESLAANHVQWVLCFGHYSTLSGVYLGRVQPADPPVPSDAPAAMRVVRDIRERALDNMARHGLQAIDYQNRRNGFYNEGLAFHHSYQPSVDRMIRRTQIFAQETADYPAVKGFAYTWFPSIGGYVEGGVATDPYFALRMEALNAKVRASTGATPPDAATQRALGRAPETLTTAQIEAWRAYFRAREHQGWFDSFTLYNARMKEVRSDLVATTFENAGHDLGKLVRDIGGAHDAMGWESYTDYGDWPMSSGFTVDWTRGNLPGKPVWLTVEGLQTDSAMVGDLMHAFARGATGLGVAMLGPGDGLANARRGRALAFFDRYGSLMPDLTVDHGVAVMTSELDGRGLYDAHALWAHLSRLGVPPVVLSEAVIERQGVPAGTRVIFTANLKYPYTPAAAEKLQAWMAAGGKLVQVGTTSDIARIDGARQAPMDLKQLWDVGGFAKAHLAFWESFRAVRPELETLLAEVGETPRFGAAPEQALIMPFRSGGLTYIAVVASPLSAPDTDFTPIDPVAVKVPAGSRVRDLVSGLELQVSEGGTVQVPLATTPAALLAVLPPDLGPVALQVPAKATAGETLRLSAELAATPGATAAGEGGLRGPVQLTLRSPDGTVRGEWFRLSGDADAVTYRLATWDAVGDWQVVATDLLNGSTATTTIPVTTTAAASADPAGVVAAPSPVFTPSPERVDAFLARQSRVRVVVEQAQGEAALASAGQLVTALRAAGRDAALQQVDAASFDTVKLRWFPTTVEAAQMAEIDAGQMVGYRGNMVAYIDKITREHVPARGGWTDVGPSYMLRTDVVLFDDGASTLASSLVGLTDWLSTPQTPGRGQSALSVVYSPFWADCQALVIAANDAAGRDGAVARLVAALAPTESVHFAAASPAVSAPPTIPAPVRVAGTPAGTTAEKRASFATPLADYVPPSRVRDLVADANSGYLAVRLDDRVVGITADGKIAQVRPAPPAAAIRVAGEALEVLSHVAALPTFSTTAMPSWGSDTVEFWQLQVEHFAPPTAEASGGTVALRRLGAGGGLSAALPKHWDLAYHPLASAATATGEGRYAFGLLGGGMAVGTFADAKIYRDDGLETAPFAEALRDPVLPTAMALSGDGRRLAWTVADNPTGYGGMGTFPAITPFATSLRLLDLETAQVRFVKWADALDDTGFAAGRHCLALNRDGSRIAWLDSMLTGHLVDDKGTLLWQVSLADPAFEPRRPEPPLRCELSDDGGRALFAGLQVVLVVDKAGQPLIRLVLPALVDARLTGDGSTLVVALSDGTVRAWTVPSTPLPATVSAATPGVSVDGVTADDAGGLPDIAAASIPEPRWTLSTEGSRPRLAVTASGLWIAEGVGNLLRVNLASGEVAARLPVFDAPLTVAASNVEPNAEPAAQVPLYREPGGLAVVTRWGGKTVAEWSPDATNPPSAKALDLPTLAGASRTFHAVDAPLTLSFTAPHDALVRLVYRHDTPTSTLALKSADGNLTFQLDLPTPTYRVVELPVRCDGKPASVTLKPGPGCRVASLTVTAFTYPGPNIAYVKPPSEAVDAGDAMATPVTGGDAMLGNDLTILDPTDTAQAGNHVSGAYKKAEIYANNTDPDRVAGFYFRETADPLASLDGHRFPASPAVPWVRWKPNTYSAIMGARLLVNLNLPVKPQIALAWARTYRQSEIPPAVAILQATPNDFFDANPDGPEALTRSRRVLAGRFDNDQFCLILDLGTPTLTAFAAYVCAPGGIDHGLAEVELY